MVQYTFYTTNKSVKILPGEDTEDEVHDEEWAEDNHRHEVDELPGAALPVTFKMAAE